MPQIRLKVQARSNAGAMNEAYMAIARTLSDPVPPDEDLLNAVKGFFTVVSIQERDAFEYVVDVYGSFGHVARYESKRAKAES